jgi:hypothetical protein
MINVMINSIRTRLNVVMRINIISSRQNSPYPKLIAAPSIQSSQDFIEMFTGEAFALISDFICGIYAITEISPTNGYK